MAKIERINELIREELAIAINRELVINNGLVTISYVKCSLDLTQARVGFSVLPDNLAGSTLRKLASLTSILTKHLRARTKLRHLPKLIWEFDATEKEASHLEKIINEAQIN